MEPGIFTKSELVVGFGVTAVVASLVLVRTNFLGFLSNILLITFGFLLTAVGK